MLTHVILLAHAATRQPPTVYTGSANTIAVIVLILEFGMLRASLLRSQISLYAVQSAVVSILAFVVAAVENIPELYALAAISFLLKVIIVPLIVLGLLRRSGQEIAGSGVVGVASEVIIALVVSAFGFFTVGALHIDSPVLSSTALSVSFAVVLVSFVLMILRRDVISQAIGFFSLDNGISMTSLVVAAGLPLIIEVAFLFDLLVAVVVFAVLIRVHHSTANTLSTVNLNRLRG